MTIVFDTNIYIAAFRSRGYLFELLLKVLKRGSGYLLYISPPIKEELLKKLEEEFEPEAINGFIAILEQSAYWVVPVETIDAVKTDPDDNKILECAVAAEANLVVTMDKDLLKLKIFRRIAIVHPKTFNYMLPKG